MYDRKLLEYLPPVLRGVREYGAILEDAQQPEMVSAWGGLENVLKDQFIVTATENGVKRWEQILGIVPKGTESLDARKFTILARMNEQLPFTYAMLEEQLRSLCGVDNYTLTIQHGDYGVYVQVGLKAKSNYDDVAGLLRRVVPANMVLYLSLKYNQQQTLAKFTHRELGSHTHNQLRNEVLA